MSAECCKFASLNPPYCLRQLLRVLRVYHALIAWVITRIGLWPFHLDRWEPVLPGRSVLTNGKRPKFRVPLLQRRSTEVTLTITQLTKMNYQSHNHFFNRHLLHNLSRCIQSYICSGNFPEDWHMSLRSYIYLSHIRLCLAIECKHRGLGHMNVFFDMKYHCHHHYYPHWHLSRKFWGFHCVTSNWTAKAQLP